MRTLATRLKGLAALAGILAIVAGLPVLLVATGAEPLTDIQTLGSSLGDLLMAPDDGTLALIMLRLIAWIAWALLTLSLLVEAAALIRGTRAPRLPGLPQGLARTLVGTALLAFIAAPTANAAAAHAMPAETVTAQPLAVVTAPADPAQDKPAQAAQQPEAPPATQMVRYTVQSGDTLWQLAETHLGDGMRFKEIHDLNRAVLGDDPGFLDPGTVLSIPAHQAPAAVEEEAAPAKEVVVDKGDTLSGIAAEELGDPGRYPEIFEASQDIPQPGGARLTDPDLILPGWTVQIPGTEAAPTETSAPITTPKPGRSQAPSSTTAGDQEQTTPGQDAGTAASEQEQAGQSGADTTTPAKGAEDTAAADQPAAVAPTTPAATQAPRTTQPIPAQTEHTQPQQTQTETTENDGLGEDMLWQVTTAAGVGTVLAAGVLGLVTRRRREQQRLRRPGQSMPLPAGATAEFEQEIRAAADPLSVETVDTALRSLARHCAEAGQPLPVVRAGRLTADRFELYLEDPAQLPAPWIDTAEAKIWTLEVEDTDQLAPVNSQTVTAPYPSLVTIGHDVDEHGHVFLNLEHLGALGVTGDDPSTREILAALAIELATSVWADDLQVTLIGAFPELEDALRTGRIRYLPTVGRVAEELAQRAEDDRHAMADADIPDLYTARATGALPDTWYPEIVLIAGELPDRQRTQLAELVEQAPHVALATITSGTTVGEWSLNLTGDDNLAVLEPIGLQVHPQRLPWEQYGHLLELVAIADVEELPDTDAPSEPSVAQVEAITPVDDNLGPASAMPAVTLAMVDQPADDAVTSTVPTGDQSEAPSAVTSAPDNAGGATEVPAVETQSADNENQEPDPQGISRNDLSEETVPAVTAAPQILMLGPVDITGARGRVEPSKRGRLLEHAAYLVMHPGATHSALDDALWPDRKNQDNMNTRNTATSKLRSWFGKDENGEDYLPRNPSGGGYAFGPAVTSDIDHWDQIIKGDPLNASTEALERALKLVRGIPFDGTHTRRYGWAEPIRQRLISEIVDASYELGKRRLMEGRWRAAEQALTVGIAIEPAQENLWRIRILAAHESRNPEHEARTIERLLTITEQLECDLEPETNELLSALKNPGTDFDRLMAHAL